MACTREELIAEVRETLARAGFYVSKPLNMRSISFDIVARRDKSLLIIEETVLERRRVLEGERRRDEGARRGVAGLRPS